MAGTVRLRPLSQTSRKRSRVKHHQYYPFVGRLKPYLPEQLTPNLYRM